MRCWYVCKDLKESPGRYSYHFLVWQHTDDGALVKRGKTTEVLSVDVLGAGRRRCMALRCEGLLS